MRSLSAAEAQGWCQEHGVAVAASPGFAPGRRPTLPAGASSLPIPVDTGAPIHLVGSQLAPYEPEPEILVWFTDWGVWPSSERPHIFERFRASYGETRPLIEVPAFLFTSGEFEDAVSFATLGVLFLWDVNVVGSSGERMLHYSHDEIVDISA